VKIEAQQFSVILLPDIKISGVLKSFVTQQFTVFN
jgi:hypothetical protein